MFFSYFALCAAAAALASPADLPNEIFVNTPTRSVTLTRAYAVEEGRIFVLDSRSEYPYWRLLGRGGVPSYKGERELPVVSISADDVQLLAVTEDHTIHRFDGKEWTKLWGLPVPGGALLGKITMPPNVRRWVLSQRHKDVLYYEDDYGNQFNWGSAGCTTLFVLLEDGKRIRMGDPWFPPDLSRQLCGPKRGRKELVSIASSASTVMVLSSDAKLYTTFYDYDVNGGTPFFRYRYFDVPLHGKPGSDPLSEFEVRGLPLKASTDWDEQPQLVDAAVISKNMAVLQNGTGNAARELRVQARHLDGRLGYFYKQLLDARWRFRETGEEIAPADVLTAYAGDENNRDLAMTGTITGVNDQMERETIAFVDTKDFNFHCSPVKLAVTTKKGVKFDVDLHLVDAWQLFADTDADDDPTNFNKLKGTIEIPNEVLTSSDKAVREAARKLFAKFHRKSFSLAVVAGQTEVIIRPVTYPYNFLASKMEIRLRQTGPKGKALRGSLPIYSGNIKPVPIGDERERQLLKNIEADVSSWKLLQALRESLEARVEATRVVNANAPLATMFMDALSVATTVRFTVPQMQFLPAIEEHLPALLTTAKEAAKLRLDRSERDYRRVRAQLLGNLCARYNLLMIERKAETLREALANSYERLYVPQTKGMCGRLGS